MSGPRSAPALEYFSRNRRAETKAQIPRSPLLRAVVLKVYGSSGIEVDFVVLSESSSGAVALLGEARTTGRLSEIKEGEPPISGLGGEQSRRTLFFSDLVLRKIGPAIDCNVVPVTGGSRVMC